MNAASDHQLLRAYAVRRDEAAFRELVQRHTDLVYSAALRQVESDAAARDLTQGVFTDLARRAPDILGKHTCDSLAGWLHRATRYAALNHLRDTRRRRDNERQAMEQLLTNSDATADWGQIRPALDDTDREALLLRYFKNQDFRAVGQQLGVSDDTAQKRVSRAVERLREFFAKRGVTVGAGALTAVISANAVQATPAGLVATISTAALLTKTAVSSSAVLAATETIAMTTLQKTIITASLAAAVGVGIYEARHAAKLRAENQDLQQQQTPLTEEIRQLRANNEALSNRLNEIGEANKLAAAQFNELLKLRGQVGQNRTALDQLTQLQRRVTQNSDQKTNNWNNFAETFAAQLKMSVTKAQQAQISRLEKMLNLTGDQSKAVSNILQNINETQLLLLSGKKLTPQQLQPLASGPDDEVKALLTPDQLSVYQADVQAQRVDYAKYSSEIMAGAIAKELDLTAAQTEQVQTALNQFYSNDFTDRNQAAAAAAVQSGSSMEMRELNALAQQLQLEGTLNVLKPILTAEQLDAYRKKETDSINGRSR